MHDAGYMRVRNTKEDEGFRILSPYDKPAACNVVCWEIYAIPA